MGLQEQGRNNQEESQPIIASYEEEESFCSKDLLETEALVGEEAGKQEWGTEINPKLVIKRQMAVSGGEAVDNQPWSLSWLKTIQGLGDMSGGTLGPEGTESPLLMQIASCRKDIATITGLKELGGKHKLLPHLRRGLLHHSNLACSGGIRLIWGSFTEVASGVATTQMPADASSTKQGSAAPLAYLSIRRRVT